MQNFTTTRNFLSCFLQHLHIFVRWLHQRNEHIFDAFLVVLVWVSWSNTKLRKQEKMQVSRLLVCWYWSASSAIRGKDAQMSSSRNICVACNRKLSSFKKLSRRRNQHFAKCDEIGRDSSAPTDATLLPGTQSGKIERVWMKILFWRKDMKLKIILGSTTLITENTHEGLMVEKGSVTA